MTDLKSFIETLRTPSTRFGYQSAMFDFVEFIHGIKRSGKRITYAEKENFYKLADEYAQSERDFAGDLVRYAAFLQNSAPKTAKQYMAAVKEFLAYNDVELTHRQLKNIRNRLPRGGARTREKDMDISVLRTILEHCDIKGRALFLTLSSGGMRLNEALKTEMDWIDLDTNPAMIDLPGTMVVSGVAEKVTKNGENRMILISGEAKEAIQEWLKVRQDYLESSIQRNNGLVRVGRSKPKSLDDNRLFPFSDDVAEQMWANALEDAGLLSIDTNTNRKQLHIHQLRKLFRTQLALGCPVDIVEELMGHEGYLTSEYVKHTRKQLSEYYLKGEHLLNIQGHKDVQRIESELKESYSKLEVENGKLRTEVASLRNEINSRENADTDSIINDLQNQMEEQGKRMESMQNWMQNLITQLPPEIVEKVKMQ